MDSTDIGAQLLSIGIMAIVGAITVLSAAIATKIMEWKKRRK